MGVVVGLLLIAVVVGAWTARSLYQRQRLSQLRNQAQLQVIEAQLAGFRSVLRLQVAEHGARQRMRNLMDDDTPIDLWTDADESSAR